MITLIFEGLNPRLEKLTIDGKIEPVRGWPTRVQESCALLLLHKLGKHDFIRKSAKLNSFLNYVREESGKFASGAKHLNRIFEIRDRDVRLRTNEQIQVTWGGKVDLTGRKLEACFKKLWMWMIRTEKPEEEELRFRLHWIANGFDFEIEFEETEEFLPMAGMKALLLAIAKKARRTTRITIGLSGGLLQSFIIDELSHSYLRKTLPPHLKIHAVALNRMNFNDYHRYERGADVLANRLLKSLSLDCPEIFFPPITNTAVLAEPYKNAVKDCDILLVSGGGRENSFVSNFLRLHHTKMPKKAVGDLVGHPLDENGQLAEEGDSEAILAPLQRQPDLPTLQALARAKDKKVILVADAIPGARSESASKALLVSAVLRRGLANHFVISKRLARELVKVVEEYPAN